jgi:hypothetical protein
MPEDQELEGLKVQYQREKNLTVLITSVVTFLCIFLVVLFGGVSVFFSKSDNANSAQTTYQLPCLSSGQKAVAASSVTIRVLNGTSLSGLGTAVSQSLQIRGFTNVPPVNSSTTDSTEIHFGLNAVPQAYTLAGNFLDPVLIVDDRKDGLIDVVVGRAFTDLQDKYLVTTMDTSQELKQPSKCVALADVHTNVALEHDATLVAPYMTDEQLAAEGIVQTDMTTPAATLPGEGTPDADPTANPDAAAPTTTEELPTEMVNDQGEIIPPQ